MSLHQHSRLSPGYLSVSKYAIRSFRSFWSGIPENGMALPGKAFCGAIMNSSSDFSSQTMFEFFMAWLYLNPGTDPACLPMTPSRPGPIPLLIFFAWQTAHLANVCSPWAASAASAEWPVAMTSPAAIAVIDNKSRLRMINSVPALEHLWRSCSAQHRRQVGQVVRRAASTRPHVGLMSTPGVCRVSSIRTRRHKQANRGMEGNPVEARPLRIA